MGNSFLLQGISLTQDRTCVPCAGRWILYHCPTLEDFIIIIIIIAVPWPRDLGEVCIHQFLEGIGVVAQRMLTNHTRNRLIETVGVKIQEGPGYHILEASAENGKGQGPNCLHTQP